MNEIQSLVDKLSFSANEFSILYFVSNILLVIILSIGLSIHYQKLGRTTGNRSSLAFTFPFIAVTILLVITVVKSSLALSLGLVGALSIVRFRTPIKDPEELAYLFFTIAIGLGVGADQRMPVLITYLFIMLFLTFRAKFWVEPATGNMIVTIRLSSNKSNIIDEINSISADIFPNIDLRRFDSSTKFTSLTYLVTTKDIEEITLFRNKITHLDDQLEMTVVEQTQIY